VGDGGTERGSRQPWEESEEDEVGMQFLSLHVLLLLLHNISIASLLHHFALVFAVGRGSLCTNSFIRSHFTTLPC